MSGFSVWPDGRLLVQLDITEEGSGRQLPPVHGVIADLSTIMSALVDALAQLDPADVRLDHEQVEIVARHVCASFFLIGELT